MLSVWKQHFCACRQNHSSILKMTAAYSRMECLITSRGSLPVSLTPTESTLSVSLQLEEKQRADARERQTLGVEWKQKVGVKRSFV